MKDIIKVFLILFIILNPFSLLLGAETEPPLFGAPYFNNSHYPYGGHPSDTIIGAVNNWWSAYQQYWHVSSCSYDLTHLDNGEKTGVFAHMALKNGCTGGDSIVGTPHCKNGYLLLNGECLVEIIGKKNFGPHQCNN